MDLAKLKWKAVHSNKNVISPNYVDIKRASLESVILIKKAAWGKDESIIEIKRPEDLKGKWLISWRLRTQLDGDTGKVSRRFWIFSDRTRGIITRVNEDGKVDQTDDWKEIKSSPIKITDIDLT